jgi:uncharacterized membrane protein YhaH (DUF805 family)
MHHAFSGMERSSMGSFGIVHWLIFVLVFAIWIIPAWRITSKAGYAGAWSLILLVPMVGAIAIWAFAFTKWPIETKAERQGTSD